jgi:hypothetical protein
MEPSGSNLVFSLRPFQGVIAVLQLLYTETTPQSGFFLKKKLPSIESVRTYVLENRSSVEHRIVLLEVTALWGPAVYLIAFRNNPWAACCLFVIRWVERSIVIAIFRRRGVFIETAEPDRHEPLE